MIFGSRSLLLCFVGSLLAALWLLTQALCVWRVPDCPGGCKGARWPQRPLPGTAINNSVPAAPKRALVPSQDDLTGSLAGGMQQGDTAEKDIFSPVRQALCCQKENNLISQDKRELKIGMGRKTEKK